MFPNDDYITPKTHKYKGEIDAVWMSNLVKWIHTDALY